MPDDAPPRDLDWYRSQWETLMEVLSVSDPEAVVEKARDLRERVERLTRQRELLGELDDPERVLHMLENMTDQLEELYAEREKRAKADSDE